MISQRFPSGQAQFSCNVHKNGKQTLILNNIFFIPSYKGKPWILVLTCKSFYYIKPDEVATDFEAGSWNYSRYKLTNTAGALTATDIDQNGYTEIYMSLGSTLKEYYFKEAASSKLSSNCMVFILACLTGSFQIADMIYA